jgi:hypothetical protein
MRPSRMAILAVSALALSLGFGPASALSPAGNAADPQADVYKAANEHGRSGHSHGHGAGTGHRSHGYSGQHHHGGRGGDFGIYVGPGYGYVSDCEWMRRRAIATGSSYWWRRYRACIN